LVLFSFAEEVKTCAAMSKWTKDIVRKVKWINCELAEENNTEDALNVYKGVTFDERVTLMLVLPIRFANLKAANVTTVSVCFRICFVLRCMLTTGFINR